MGSSVHVSKKKKRQRAHILLTAALSLTTILIIAIVKLLNRLLKTREPEDLLFANIHDLEYSLMILTITNFVKVWSTKIVGTFDSLEQS